MTSRPENLIVYGGTALLMDPAGTVVENSVVQIADGKIQSVVSDPQFRPDGKVRAVDARECLVMPGLVNGHTHAAMALFRGIADDLPLRQWLEEMIFPLEKQWVERDFVYWGTLLAVVEMIRSGTTTINDMYYFEETAAEACQEAGIRAICGQTVIEIGSFAVRKSIEERLDEFQQKIEAFPLVTPAVAPHSVYGVTEKSWRRLIDYCHRRKLTIHFHLAETLKEREDCLKTHGLTPAEFFDRLGLFSGKIIAAHGTCLTDAEIEILGRNRIGVIHNPESNLKLGTAICPVPELRAAGVYVGLGTDGVASNGNLDLFAEADFAAKLQSFRSGIGKLPAFDVVRMLTSEGARAVGLGDTIGSLERGKAADLIAVDLTPAHLVPLYHPYSQLIYSANGGDVKHSIINGRVVMEDRQLRTVDEKSILAEARRLGKKIATR